MLIKESQMQLSSQHTALSYQRQQESLTMWRDTPNGRVQVSQQSTQERLRVSAGADRLSLSPAAQQALPQRTRGVPMPEAGAPQVSVDASAGVEGADLDARNPAELQLGVLRMLLERLTGQSFKIFDARALHGDAEAGAALEQPPPEGARSTATNEREGWGVIYGAERLEVEAETTQFQAHGVVRTADGKQIALQFELNMSREFMSQTRIDVRAGDALKDPLVINFGGSAAQLSQTTFRFDLDADGRADQMRFVAPGSGFLALDQNGDGRINDGRELFGALSGNGFADLAAHDDDGNGWIDEADAVFSRLLVWSRDDDGADTLRGLLDHGIGAIFLGSAATPFDLKDDANALQGRVRASGVYLGENGSVGSVQQIDLVV